MRKLLAMVMVCCSVSLALGGEFNKTLSPGDAAPVWEKLKGVDDKDHSLAEFAAKPVVVMVFTCNSCPVAVDYEARIAATVKAYATGENAKVALVAINANGGAEETLAKMKEKAKKKQYAFPYLADPTGEVAKKYGANYTPEVVVLDKNRKVVYLGALDDKNKADDAKVNYLHAAIDAALAGKEPATKETLARGCRIKFAAK